MKRRHLFICGGKGGEGRGGEWNPSQRLLGVWGMSKTELACGDGAGQGRVARVVWAQLLLPVEQTRPTGLTARPGVSEDV